jgi:phosphorylase kinase alpha/beta subunit
VVIGHGVRLGWLQAHCDLPPASYGEHKASAWDSFYRSSPARCRELFVAALRQLADV